VSVDFNQRIEELFEQYQRQREGFRELHRRMHAISVTATSPRREVAVSVGHGGTVTDIRFPTSAYRRLAPAELTGVIMQTLAEAKNQAQDEAAAIIAPLLPQGMQAKDLLSGRVSAEALMPAQPRLPNSVLEQLGMREAPS
jgi:DNA-binding protein YbaB